MKHYLTKHKGFLHGCDYNPEQWIDYPKIIDKDMEYMKKAHCNVVSLGIFSWAHLEPAEGKYNFEFFDTVIEKLSQNNIKIILATPSGAKPRWMAEKYPETLRVGKDNVRALYGFRHNHCYTSPIYREKITKLDTEIAKRYANCENVILWHISNEFGGECHCELCQTEFRKYLMKKYDNSLKKLNHAWWAHFWSHTITDWEQIHSPTLNGEPDNVIHGLYLDWREFVTYQTTEFMKTEIKAVKSINSSIPITTNFMGPYQNLDYHYMKDFVDVISWDSYPSWHSDRGNVLEAYSIAFAHDLHRCLKDKPFLLMESTPSLTNWLPYNKLKRPGMHRLSSLQAVAHGSDSVQYFQWRKGRGGQEKFHGAVIDHNQKAEGRVFDDVKNVGLTLEKIQEISATYVKADVAVVYEFKNRWAVDCAMGFNNNDKKYKRSCINFYKQFWRRGINVDVIGLNHDLSKYKIVVLPMMYSISNTQIEKIEKFVANGGTIISTYMTGYVNETDLCYMDGFPGGRLKDIFGLVADEIDTLYPKDENSISFDGKSFKAVDYCELLTLTTAEAIGVYEKDFYTGMPAVTKNNYKKGKAYYIACRDTGELSNELIKTILDETKVKYHELPYGVTIHTRGESYTFVENYSDEDKTIVLDEDYIDLESGESINKIFNIEKYGLKILKGI